MNRFPNPIIFIFAILMVYALCVFAADDSAVDFGDRIDYSHKVESIQMRTDGGIDFLDENGSVIASLASGGKLTINVGTDNTPFLGISTDANADLYLQDDTSTGENYVGIRAKGDDLYLIGGGVAKAVVDGTGFGVVTASPLSHLDIQGDGSDHLLFPSPGVPSSRPVLELMSFSNVTGGIQFNANDTDYWNQYFSSTKFLINHGTWSSVPTDASFTLTTAGYLGIGTLFPTSILHAVGDDPLVQIHNTETALESNNAELRFLLQTSTVKRGFGSIIVTSTAIEDATKAGRMDLSVAVNGTLTEVITIDEDDVGIGTTAPSTILDVVAGSSTDPVADAWDTHVSFLTDPETGKPWKVNVRYATDATQVPGEIKKTKIPILFKFDGTKERYHKEPKKFSNQTRIRNITAVIDEEEVIVDTVTDIIRSATQQSIDHNAIIDQRADAGEFLDEIGPIVENLRDEFLQKDADGNVISIKRGRITDAILASHDERLNKIELILQEFGERLDALEKP